MESIVVTLETAKKLKAAGFPQEALFYWDEAEKQLWSETYELSPWGKDRSSLIAAVGAQELADQLPDSIGEADLITGRMPTVAGAKRNWTAWYWDISQESAEHGVEADTMAEALALLWLELHEVQQ